MSSENEFYLISLQFIQYQVHLLLHFWLYNMWLVFKVTCIKYYEREKRRLVRRETRYAPISSPILHGLCFGGFFSPLVRFFFVYFGSSGWLRGPRVLSRFLCRHFGIRLKGDLRRRIRLVSCPSLSSRLVCFLTSATPNLQIKLLNKSVLPTNLLSNRRRHVNQKEDVGYPFWCFDFILNVQLQRSVRCRQNRIWSEEKKQNKNEADTCCTRVASFIALQ